MPYFLGVIGQLVSWRTLGFRGEALPSSSRVLFLLGDSHALHLLAGLASAVKGHMSVAFACILDGAGFNADWPSDEDYQQLPSPGESTESMPSVHACE